MDQTHLPPGTADVTDFGKATPNAASQSGQPTEDNVNSGTRPFSYVDSDGAGTNVHRTDSTMSQSNTLTPSRGGTLKKKQSLKRSGSLKRSSSRRSLGAGSVKSLVLGEKEKYADGQGEEMRSPFYTPVPTSGNPTEVLANRFQAWRKVLKDLITYYRDAQKSHETRSKSLLSISNVINNTILPPVFLAEGGIVDATLVLRDFHKQALAEGNKAKSIEEDIIVQLSGLRNDLQQKIKEIKNLSGDFKNSVDKETENTRKTVRILQEALGFAETDPSATIGKNDPFIVRIGVEKQIERQIDEENYLHRAFLNLESSGRELESIVVGEIQKGYNAYAGILKREADEAYDAVDKLRTGPIAMAKDHEWDAFVVNNDQFVNPNLPIRRAEDIVYAGKDHPAAAEVRSGLLERKGKYLKSYTPGWYVLSPTHLHEFKSPDRISLQTPVMSLYLPEQKLGSHSTPDSSSHKFMLKGRQTGGIHRGHSWVFRAESHETMLAWFEDIKNLTEKTGEARTAFVRQHARSLSAGSQRAGSISSDGAMEEDEADEVPYSATASNYDKALTEDEKLPMRPQPGGRFPSDLSVNRDLRVPLSPSSGTNSDDHDVVAAATALPGSGTFFGHQFHHQTDGIQQTDAVGGASGFGQPDSQPDSYIPIKQQVDGHHNDSSPANQDPANPTSQQSLSHAQHPDPFIAASTNTQPQGGAEYIEQPVQSHGISSDGPGAVAYGAHPRSSDPSQGLAVAHGTEAVPAIRATDLAAQQAHRLNQHEEIDLEAQQPLASTSPSTSASGAVAPVPPPKIPIQQQQKQTFPPPPTSPQRPRGQHMMSGALMAAAPIPASAPPAPASATGAPAIMQVVGVPTDTGVAEVFVPVPVPVQANASTPSISELNVPGKYPRGGK